MLMMILWVEDTSQGNVVNQRYVFYGSSTQPFREGGELDLAAFQLQYVELTVEEMKG